MVRFTNTLVGILNFFVLLSSVPILITGIWLSANGSTQCERFLDKPLIALGAFLTIVAISGVVGSCCRVTWLFWFYLFVMFFLIITVLCFTIFAFVVTSKGSGETIPGKAYKEYRLEAYSDWLQKRVNNAKHWSNIRSCVFESKICSRFSDSEPVSAFYKEHLTSLQSGCCKPSNDCNFTYISPTTWNKTSETNKNSDCQLWDSQKDKLCYNCQACKAGFIDNLNYSWKRAATVNIVFLIMLIVVYGMGCCAFRNNKREERYARPTGFNNP
ncbi:PREDICTED: tetraspanin-9-like [Camelina sativa]|uniref:Tetraspanin-9-like n=1 Tax=Camelina sativa TaxID=90675 RepID=A0ABM0UXC4_CAMSA|nr:PREDICTED: tetraspanin-9-like [Camelina sativa]